MTILPDIRVLYIIERMAAGGTEKQLAALIRGLEASCTVKTHLCTLRPSESLLASLSIPKIELGHKRLLSPRTALQIKRLAGFCREHRINLVQTFFQDPSVIGAILKALLPVKLIVSFRDLGFWRNRAENLKMRLVCHWADGFIANSMSVKAHFAAMDKIRPERIAVLRNGFERRPAVPNGMPPAWSSRGGPVVGIVGNCNRAVKRMGDFIEVAARVKQLRKDAAFIVIGDGSQMKRLQLRCQELGIAGDVHFTGRLEDPFAYIRQFAVGLSTSASEGFSNAVIEYMACGVPVVVTDVDGNREMVEEGVNGFRVPVGDPRAMAERVVALLDNPDLMRRMGTENIKTVDERYSMQRMICAHESYYVKLLTCNA